MSASDLRPRLGTQEVEPILTTRHPRAQCVDLRATFAGRFRFAWDDAYQAERLDLRAVEAPWLTIIPGQFGKVFPWGGRRLAAYARASRARRDALAAVPGVTVLRGGGDCPEIVVGFDVDALEAVAAVLRLKRPRTPLTPEQRAAFIARGQAFRFRRKDGENAAPGGAGSTNGSADMPTTDVIRPQDAAVPPAGQRVSR
jgi:hypothetical protein